MRRRLLVGAAIVAVLVAASAAGATGRVLANVQSVDPEWSPDGKRIAFIDLRGTVGTLYVMNAAGGGVRQLTENGFDAGWPTWSPDGRRIAFEHATAPTPDAASEINVVNVDGSGLHTVVSDGAEPAWGPGGKQIAFTRRGPLGNERISTVSPDGTGVRLVADPHDECEVYIEPTWSPDGEHIAFTATGAGGECGFRAFIGASRGYGAKVKVLAGGSYVEPDWSPSGRRIALVRAGGNPYFAVRVVDLRTGHRARDLRAGWHPRWSPDGHRLVFVRGNPFGSRPSSGIYVMDADGSNLRQLTP